MGALVALSEGSKKGRHSQQVRAGQYLQLQEEEKGDILHPGDKGLAHLLFFPAQIQPTKTKSACSTVTDSKRNPEACEEF